MHSYQTFLAHWLEISLLVLIHYLNVLSYEMLVVVEELGM